MLWVEHSFMGIVFTTGGCSVAHFPAWPVSGLKSFDGDDSPLSVSVSLINLVIPASKSSHIQVISSPLLSTSSKTPSFGRSLPGLGVHTASV